MDVPSAVYHALPFCSASRLNVLRDKSPAHLRWKLDHPEEQTDAMRVGEATHYAVLQPELFEERYVLFEGEMRSKEQKDRWAEIHDAGQVALRESEWEMVLGIRDAVAAHPKASRLIDGQAEMTLVWEEEGLTCMARLDLLSSVTPTIVDLKTAKDASLDGFRKAVWNRGYHIQAAHYMAGARALGIEVEHFVDIAAEKKPPYGIAVYRLMEDVIGSGVLEREKLMDQWARCQRDDSWPSYPDRVTPLTFPTWMHNEVDRRVG
jgi:hypothetical protein